MMKQGKKTKPECPIKEMFFMSSISLFPGLARQVLTVILRGHLHWGLHCVSKNIKCYFCTANSESGKII